MYVFGLSSATFQGYLPATNSASPQVGDLVTLVCVIRTSGQRCRLLVSLDIPGAFDHAWWLVDYLVVPGNPQLIQNRLISTHHCGSTSSKPGTKGCMHELNFDPSFCTLLVDDLLTDFGVVIQAQAYADDLVIIVEPQSLDSFPEYSARLGRLFPVGSGQQARVLPGEDGHPFLETSSYSPVDWSTTSRSSVWWWTPHLTHAYIKACNVGRRVGEDFCPRCGSPSEQGLHRAWSVPERT